MAFYLRKIRRAKWEEENGWPPVGDIQADAVVDLKTENNILSVWKIEDDKSNLRAVIGALSANSDSITNFDYVLLSEDSIIAFVAPEQIKSTDGNSPSPQLNKQFHYEFQCLTLTLLVELAHEVKKSSITRLSSRALREIIRESVSSGYISEESLKDKIKAEIQKI